MKKGLLLFVIALFVGLLSACGQKQEIPEVGDTITFGTYEQDNDTSNGPEDIEWIVLAVEDERVLVISKYGLDARPYHDSWMGTTWAECDLRFWLNGTFLYTAFSDEERSMIPVVDVTAEDNPFFGTPAGRNTSDKVFLLSLNEAETYFTSDEDRACAPTAYAIAQGAWVADESFDENAGNGLWYLRSPGEYSHLAGGVRYDGYIFDSGLPVNGGGGTISHGRPIATLGVRNSDDMVRPALWIDYAS